MQPVKVAIQMNDGFEHVITGEIRYETTIRADVPWADITIRVPNAHVVIGTSQPDQIDLADCHVCGAPQGPLILSK